MDVDRFLNSAGSRRAFFRTAGVGLAGGSAVLLAACGGDDGGAATGPASGSTPDVEILNSALDLENTAVAAYAAGARHLKGSVRATGVQFLSQEREHAAALGQAIKQLGGTPTKTKAAYDFPEFKGQEDVLNFALDLEGTAVAAYIDALPKVSDPELRGTASAILTNEAEHISVLLGALGRPQVPSAFVIGGL